MSASNSDLPDGQRQPRRARKANAPKNKDTSKKTPSIPTMIDAPASTPYFYDGSSEPNQPTSHRKPRKQSHVQEIHQSFPMAQDPASTHRGRSQGFGQTNPPSHMTPVKSAAYAGPTFHASPAASALPIPKMFSKSLPDVGSMLPTNMSAEDSDLSQTDPEETPISSSQTPEPKERQPSPLDFLFDAARQARNTPRHTQSPGSRPGNLSREVDGARAVGHDTPPGRASNMFPFELDGSNTSSSSIGPAFATPYKDRMNSYRSGTHSGQNTESDLHEHERLMKAEGLKRLLGHSPSPKPSDATVQAGQYHRPPAQRNASGPTPPTYSSPISISPQLRTPPASSHSDFSFHDVYAQRPPSSKLRQQVSPNAGEVSVPTPPPSLNSPSPSRTPRAMDAKRLEDDLRRVLKLDVSG